MKMIETIEHGWIGNECTAEFEISGYTDWLPEARVTFTRNGKYEVTVAGGRVVSAHLADNKRDLNAQLASARIIPKKVIYNGPATIVIWADGSKTVVKCSEGDVHSKEAGLALCFMKKIIGNESEGFHRYLKDCKTVEYCQP